MEEDFTRIWSYADTNQNKFIGELKEIVTQPSISAQNLGLKECAEIVRGKMSALGIKTQQIPIPDAPNIIFGELESNEKTAHTLVIYNHYDVQPVEPLSEWKSDPFKPEIRENKLYGRGVGDDKGEIAARLCAIKSIIDTGNSIRPRIRWIIEGEEETGSVHFHKFVIKNRSLLKGDGCLWEGGDRSTSGTPEVHLGVKGLLYVEYRLKVGRKDQHSMYGPIAPNPAWRLINLLTTIRDDKGRIKIEGFYDRVAKPTAQEKEFLRNNEFD
ncbi:MAG TPA: M20/M25/M40 family metallo-hydrolase, partial [Nitrososphaerales archaeon]|nr:M20/M25/M40 family metallo-hydrolase [Nitrososphaerales archaeon]